MIKTEMVTVKIPNVIKSYQDIGSDPDVKPKFIVIYDCVSLFESAGPGSPRSKVLQNVDLNHREDYLIDMDVESISVIPKFLSRKSVLIQYSVLFMFEKYFLIPWSELFERDTNIKYKFYMATDKSENAMLRALAFNSELSSGHKKKIFAKISQYRQSAMYLATTLEIRRYMSDFFKSFIGMPFDFSKIDIYISDKIILPKPIHITPSFSYFVPLLYNYFASIFVCLLVLVIEKWYHRSSK